MDEIEFGKVKGVEGKYLTRDVQDITERLYISVYSTEIIVGEMMSRICFKINPEHGCGKSLLIVETKWKGPWGFLVLLFVLLYVLGIFHKIS